MDDLRHLLPLLIPIVAIVGGLSIPILYIVTQFKKRQQMLEQNHKERMLALDKGIELPPIPVELLANESSDGKGWGSHAWHQSPEQQLRSGLFWLLIGAALGVALWMEPDGRPVWALIPVAAGLAKLIFYAMAPKASANNGAPSK